MRLEELIREVQESDDPKEKAAKLALLKELIETERVEMDDHGDTIVGERSESPIFGSKDS